MRAEVARRKALPLPRQTQHGRDARDHESCHPLAVVADLTVALSCVTPEAKAA